MIERTMECPEWATSLATNTYLPGRAYWLGHEGYASVSSTETDKYTRYDESSSNRCFSAFTAVYNIPSSREPVTGDVETEEVKTSAYHRLMQSQFPPVYDDNGEFLGIMVDFYDVALAFDPENRTAPEDHALKKLILPGKRGVKDVLKDLGEVIWSLQAGIRIRVAEKRKQDFNSKK